MARIPLGERTASYFFKLNLFYLVAVFALAAFYSHNDDVRRYVPSPVWGIVPIGVVMAGALGGITISLYGVFRYGSAKRWKKEQNYWHAARPIMGALLGSIGFLVFVVTVQATGLAPPLVATTTTTTSPADAAPPGIAAPAEGAAPGDDTAPTTTTTTEPPREEGKGDPHHLVPYYLVAFLVGFREETFRELMKRVADLVFKSEGRTGRAVLYANPLTGPAPLTVVFDGTASVFVDSWTLDFGDGTSTSPASGPVTTQTHAYKQAGDYTASLTVTDESGGTSAATASVSVSAPGGEGAKTITVPATPPTTETADSGVQRLLAAASDDERRRIEQELIEETDKFVEGPDADHP